MQVWTFLIIGGQEFTLALKNNPTLDHIGGRTVWKFVGTESSAQALEVALKSFDCMVTRTTETESPEQVDERLALLGQGAKVMTAKWSDDLATDMLTFRGIKP
jgi:hypothetical protein